MSNINQIKLKIKSISSTEQITKAMKMVAAARFDKIHNLTKHLTNYSNIYYDILKRCTSSTSDLADAKIYITEKSSINNILYIILSSNKGMCGYYNQAVFKKALAIVEDCSKQYPNAKISLLTIGEKAFLFFKKKSYPIIGDFVNVFANLNYESSTAISSYLNKAFVDFKYDKILVCYNDFVNTVSYNPIEIQYLPIIIPTSPPNSIGMDTCIYEPNQKEIFNKLIIGHLEVSMYKHLLSASASEYSSRMTAMHKATDNAQKLIKNLKVEYNRGRQAKITQEITEIISGIDL